MSTYRKLLDSFEGKYQLILRNVSNFSEYVSYPFSYVTFFAVVFSWFVVNFGLGLYLAKTVLARWMDPIYIETKNQKKIFSLASLVEILEQKIDLQTKFISTLQKVIQGKSEEILLPIHTDSSSDIAKQVEKVSVIREKNFKQNSEKSPSILFFPPINGMVTEPFNRKNEHYGVDIVAGEKESIKAISAGVVIFSDWSVDTGWVIVIQHHNNFVSISKHCAVLFKKVGNLVRVGDVVALMGNSGEISTGPHLHFELWSEGIALNPEDFINF